MGCGVVPLRERRKGRLHAVFDTPLSESIQWASTIALADYDGDGLIDIYIGNWPCPSGPEEENLLLRNRTEGTGHWLWMRLVGSRQNTTAIGAVVTVEATIGGESKRLLRRVCRRRHGGAWTTSLSTWGSGTRPRWMVEVRWPDGTRERYEVEGVDRTVELVQLEGTPIP